VTGFGKHLLTCASLAVAVLPVWLAVTLLPNQGGLRIKYTSVRTVAETIDLFKENGFDPQKDISGNDPELPPVFITDLPDDLKAVPDTDIRKAVFISIVLPHVLFANEKIRADRRRLQQLHRSIAKERTLRTRDRRWLEQMAKNYRTSRMDTEELLRRVDIVPPRLAVAQAVQETGWGTSRFAQAGNALFGQHAPLGAGSIQASGNAKVALKSFDTLQDSVRDYMRNLNRNRAYRGFRAARASMRASQRPLDEIELVGTLALYSEEGRVYVERLRTVMYLPEVQAVKHAGFVDPR
tara:strand:+ start:2054 stop:2938 length:885 start_codon:yes stop_codon:yes gene_type:complete